MKRIFDIFASMMGLIAASPILLPTAILVWRQDGCSPFYIAPRVGIGERNFQMVKLRSMVLNADRSGVDSTSGNDPRITPIGRFIRKYKLDELTQLWNVLIGDMSFVGPRPNVQIETSLYTLDEKQLLTVRPGITDFSSIVFSDEGDILKGVKDPDIAYNQLIRPWKSRLGLVYVNNQSMMLDFQLIVFTIIAIFSRKNALTWVEGKLKSLKADPQIIQVSRRSEKLYPYPPPGMDEIVTSRG